MRSNTSSQYQETHMQADHHVQQEEPMSGLWRGGAHWLPPGAWDPHASYVVSDRRASSQLKPSKLHTPDCPAHRSKSPQSRGPAGRDEKSQLWGHSVHGMAVNTPDTSCACTTQHMLVPASPLQPVRSGSGGGSVALRCALLQLLQWKTRPARKEAIKPGPTHWPHILGEKVARK